MKELVESSSTSLKEPALLLFSAMLITPDPLQRLLLMLPKYNLAHSVLSLLRIAHDLKTKHVPYLNICRVTTSLKKLLFL